MEIINKKLVAAEGMLFTNGEAFGKTVYLAPGADALVWYEVTEAEAEVRKRDLEEAQAEDYEKALSEMGVAV